MSLHSLYRTIDHRVRLTGMISLQDLSVSLGVSDLMILRAVKAGTFPAPLLQFGRKWWQITAIRQYFKHEAEAAQQHATEERAPLVTPVSTLARGNGHGRRA